jgi:hypothetical protein
MLSPVFIDGPMKGQNFPITQGMVEGGQILCQPDLDKDPTIYTLTRVGVFGRVVVVASTAGGMPQLGSLFEHLISPAGQEAAE